MVEIKLTKGMTALLDDEDRHLAEYRWCFSHGYAVRGRPRALGGGNIYLHRDVMRPPRGVEVDHINGDTLDCRRPNLRLVTHQQNMLNKRKRSTNISGFTGVVKCGKRWRAQFVYRGRLFIVGVADQPAQAALLRDEFARSIAGEFVRLNFPETQCQTSTSPVLDAELKAKSG